MKTYIVYLTAFCIALNSFDARSSDHSSSDHSDIDFSEQQRQACIAWLNQIDNDSENVTNTSKNGQQYIAHLSQYNLDLYLRAQNGTLEPWVTENIVDLLTA